MFTPSEAELETRTNAFIAACRPTGDRVLVRIEKAPEVNAAGLYVGRQARKEFLQRGVIMKTGPGALSPEGVRLPLAVQAGERVIFNLYAAQEVRGLEDLLLVCESEIHAVKTFFKLECASEIGNGMVHFWGE